jgi:hypothetical protein
MLEEIWLIALWEMWPTIKRGSSHNAKVKTKQFKVEGMS